MQSFKSHTHNPGFSELFNNKPSSCNTVEKTLNYAQWICTFETFSSKTLSRKKSYCAQDQNLCLVFSSAILSSV